MSVADPAGEWLRLAEHYRQMAEEELLVLARIRAELTEAAQQALTAEMQHRGLKYEPEAPVPQVISPYLREPASSLPVDEAEEEDPYAEERKFVELQKVWSMRDVLQVQWLLNRAGIPFFLGARKAGTDQFTLNFAEGVSVYVMSVGLYWARQALEKYEPLDEPPPEPVEEWKEIPVRCPKCQSTEVVFEEVTGDPKNSESRFQWTCDQCWNRWEDDRVANG